MRLIILLFIIFFSTTELHSQTKSTGPFEFPKSGIELDVDITFLTTGERFFKVANSDGQYERWNKNTEYDGSFKYRVSFILSEIYYSLLIEKIKLPRKESEEKKAIERNLYTGFDIAENILEYGRLTNLSFKGWKDFRTFELLESDESLEIEILSNGEIKITKK